MWPWVLQGQNRNSDAATNSQVLSPRLSFLSDIKDGLVTVIFALLHCLSFQKQGRGLSESTQSLSAAYQVCLSNDRRGEYSKRDVQPLLALLWARMDFELHPCAFLCAAPIWGCQAAFVWALVKLEVSMATACGKTTLFEIETSGLDLMTLPSLVHGANRP